ncbi:hypothetical protein [Prochlorococcus sp. MIT 1011]|uniref:hypothetical protein n=1 Tax=Prochlorococcus sp. MIT 1011 TaxID=3082520 RepID=UPI0039B5B35D
MKKIKKIISKGKTEIDFQDIDRQLLVGFECNQYDDDNKKFLSMIREQTNSALDNKKYWNAKY